MRRRKGPPTGEGLPKRRKYLRIQECLREERVLVGQELPRGEGVPIGEKCLRAQGLLSGGEIPREARPCAVRGSPRRVSLPEDGRISGRVSLPEGGRILGRVSFPKGEVPLRGGRLPGAGGLLGEGAPPGGDGRNPGPSSYVSRSSFCWVWEAGSI